jgi:four helix bundle protein
MTPEELRERTMDFGVRVAALIEPLFASPVTRENAEQLGDASSSVGSNYGAACVARSHAEFRAKIGVALEEADESVFWLEFLRRTGRAKGPVLEALLAEGKELARILSASARTSRRRGGGDDLRRRRRRRRPTRRERDGQ